MCRIFVLCQTINNHSEGRQREPGRKEGLMQGEYIHTEIGNHVLEAKSLNGTVKNNFSICSIYLNCIILYIKIGDDMFIH